MSRTSYIRILQAIETFANQHLQVKRFASDFPTQLPNFGNDDEQYPILFVSPSDSIFNENTNTFQIKVYCFDIIEKDRSNINTILSDTNSVLNDLNLWLRFDEVAGIDILESTTATPINNSLLDFAAGWVMSMTLEVDAYTICEIPFDEFPSVIDVCNDIIYTSYLTCNSLADCPVIQDIEEKLMIVVSGASLQAVTNIGNTTTNDIIANSFIKSGGTNQQILLADGSVGNLNNFSGITGSGTTNYVPRFTTSGTITTSDIYNAGNNLVGIGTNNPRNIAGYSNLTIENAINGGSLHFRGSGSSDLGGIIADANSIHIRTSLPTLPILFSINNLEKSRISVNGNMLINTITDNGIDKLQVIGSAIIQGIRITSSAGLSDVGVGQDVLISTTNPSAFLTAIGNEVLKFNTTGTFNSGFGFRALTNNTTGTSNTSVGINSMILNTIGGFNNAFGRRALDNNINGSSNIAIGYLAGSTDSTGNTNSSPQQSIYIGEDTRPLTVNQTNQIVIGHNAVGNGSNSVTIGNNSITKTILKGNIGVGTTNPRVSAGFSNLTLENLSGGTVHFRTSGSTEIGTLVGRDNGFIMRTLNLTTPIIFAINDITKMMVSVSGNTLINTIVDNGVDKLQVNGTTNTTFLKVGTGAFTGTTAEIVANGNVSQPDQTLVVQNRNANQMGGLVSRDDTGTKFLSMGVAGSTSTMGNTYGLAGEGVIRASTNSNALSLIALNGAMKFSTSVAAVERMRITQVGTILFNTTVDNGLALLQSNGHVSANGRIFSTGGGDPEISVTNASLSVSGGSPRLSLVNTTEASNSRVADLQLFGGINLRFRNDAGNAALVGYNINGSFTGITSHNWNIGSSQTMILNSTGLGIGTTTPNASAKVQINSTTQGFLPPRMTEAQRLAISSPSIGLMVYQTDNTEGVYVNSSTGWRVLTWL